MSAHTPVLVAEVLALLAPAEGGVYVDATFGRGGYAKALLDAAPCRVYAIDRDPDAIELGRPLIETYGDRLVLLLGRFSEMARLLAGVGVASVDGIAFDLGVSSPQLDTATRGFSFQLEGPLDMRMGREGVSAAEVVNEASQGELTDIIATLGEEPSARRVARAICAARAKAPIETTVALAEVVARVVPKRPGLHPATRTFQALRIYVNDELNELRLGLAAAERLLKPGGRLVVVAFHSLEDRLVKRFLRRRSGKLAQGSRHMPAVDVAAPQPSFRNLTRGAAHPSAAEIAANPRARSARLRAAIRTVAPPFAYEDAA